VIDNFRADEIDKFKKLEALKSVVLTLAANDKELRQTLFI
jgi:hypothetical protein